MNKNSAIKILFIFCLMATLLVNANDSALDKNIDGFQLDFTTVSYDQWQETLNSYKGTVLVVDMWATWCISCLERFPYMVEMNKEFKDKNVSFVSLLLEDPEEPEAIERAKGFLIKQKANFKHYFMNENLMLSFEKLDLLGIPAVFIYSTDGKLYQRLTGDNPNKQFTEKDIKNSLDTLLKNSH